MVGVLDLGAVIHVRIHADVQIQHQGGYQFEVQIPLESLDVRQSVADVVDRVLNGLHRVDRTGAEQIHQAAVDDRHVRIADSVRRDQCPQHAADAVQHHVQRDGLDFEQPAQVFRMQLGADAAEKVRQTDLARHFRRVLRRVERSVNQAGRALETGQRPLEYDRQVDVVGHVAA